MRLSHQPLGSLKRISTRSMMKQINCLVVLIISSILYYGCSLKETSKSSIPKELVIEETQLRDIPNLEPLTFIPVQGTQNEILAKRKQQRDDVYTDNSFFDNYQFGMSLTQGNDIIKAIETTTPNTTDKGTFEKVYIQITRNGENIYSIPAGDGSPVTNLRGLWSYSNHWVLEIAYVTETFTSSNEVSDYPIGKIVQDGRLINDQYKLEEAFGFQLMNGKPFYFFKRGNKIGISFEDKEINLNYDQVPHYQCCSGSAMNPKVAKRMVSFFAQRDGKWYYVEIGDY
jgi:hypothetical protein